MERALKLSGGDADSALEQLTQTAAAPDTHVTPQGKPGASSAASSAAAAAASSAAQRRLQSEGSGVVKEEEEADDLVSDVRQSGIGRRRLVKGGSTESVAGAARPAAPGVFPERKVDPSLTSSPNPNPNPNPN